MNPLHDAPLGKTTNNPLAYDPKLLFGIDRMINRQKLGINQDVPFFGVDLWNAYEVSWLNAKGKPQIAVITFTVPSDSPRIIESKSWKLYLNSLNNHRFGDELALLNTLKKDLSRVAGAEVNAQIQPKEKLIKAGFEDFEGQLIDRLDIEVNSQESPDAKLLSADTNLSTTEECLVSHLLKSNCPVTGQPDWASIQIRYVGNPINQEGLLRYLIAFREHQEFHEHCVEKIFIDIKRECRPSKLSVYARYTRRGGIDINPFRADYNAPWPSNIRHVRQ